MARLIYSTRPPVPIEALRLNEDIQALKQARKLIRGIMGENDELWKITQHLQMIERDLEGRLRREYLDPRKEKIEQNHKGGN